MKVGDYEIRGKLGSGTTSLVLKGLKNDQFFALKVNYCPKNEALSSHLHLKSCQEYGIHKLLTDEEIHPNPILYGIPKAIEFLSVRGDLEELAGEFIEEKLKGEFKGDGYYDGIVVVEIMPSLQKLDHRHRQPPKFFEDLRRLVDQVHDHGLSIPSPIRDTLRMYKNESEYIPCFPNWKEVKFLNSLGEEQRNKIIHEDNNGINDLARVYASS